MGGKLILILLVAIGLAAWPGRAFAGGWVIVTVDGVVDRFVAGQAQRLGFMVRQHGVHPIGGQQARIVFTHQESGEQVASMATDDGPEGHYVARFTLPREGWWDWKIQVWGDHPMPPVQAIAPAEATGHAATTAIQPAEPAHETRAPDRAALAAWAAAAATLLGGVAIAVRRQILNAPGSAGTGTVRVIRRARRPSL